MGRKYCTNVAASATQFQAQWTTLHYTAGDQEKEMEYKQGVRLIHSPWGNFHQSDKL